MSIWRLFARQPTAPVARERLKIMLSHERAMGGQSDLIAKLREEILAVIARHVPVDPDGVQVRLDRGTTVSVLDITVEMPAATAAALAA
jgi:cell division topological specificity factor